MSRTNHRASSTPTQTTGFATRNSWGYVVYYQLDYNDLFMGATLSPREAFSHDVHGVGPTFNQGSRSLSIGGALVSADKRWKLDLSYTDYIGGNMIGTPEALIEHHNIRKEMVGDYEMLANFSFGGLPYEMVYEQMKLFADKVLPHIKG